MSTNIRDKELRLRQQDSERDEENLDLRNTATPILQITSDPSKMVEPSPGVMPIPPSDPALKRSKTALTRPEEHVIGQRFAIFA